MDLEKENEQQIETITQPVVEKEKETQLDNLPRLEDLLKSEKEVRQAPELKGLKKVDNEIVLEDKPFSLKKDQKKKLLKRRAKIVSVVYASVMALLFVFTCVNIATLINLNKQINDNVTTLQSQSGQIMALEKHDEELETPADKMYITLNEPRDYKDDTKELTFLDKITILIKNIF